ncbi:hypothetical protein IAU60_006669 [Kwoniella sp. DSM 27419]
MTFLLTHPAGLSLCAINKPFTNSLDPTTLNIPSRFPSESSSGSIPHTAVSPAGHVYLYSNDTHLIWEYDPKGRRISELGFPGEKVGMVCPVSLKKEGSDLLSPALAVSLKGKSGIRLMGKEGSKWKSIRKLDTPSGDITTLCANSASDLLVYGSASGQLAVHDLLAGTGATLPLPEGPHDAIATCTTFVPSTSDTLLVVAGPKVLLVTSPDRLRSELTVREIRSATSSDIVQVAFPPVAEGSEAVRKGGLCALLSSNGEVRLIGDLSAPKSITLDRSDVNGLVFLDGATLGLTTAAGTLLIKDLRALSEPAQEISCAQPISLIRRLPVTASIRTARPSLAPSVSTSSRRGTLTATLGENRRLSNMPTPSPALQQIPDARTEKGKEVIRVASVEEFSQEQPKVRAEGQEARVRRSSSASSVPADRGPQEPRIRGPRSSSGPAPRTSSSSVPTGIFTPAPRTAPILEEDEETEGSSSGSERTARVVEREHSVQLDWALRPSSVPVGDPEAGVGPQAVNYSAAERDRIMELTRWVTDLQLDMLRMKREHRNDIRRAVQPFQAELETSRETIVSQQREIERLRRGY